jgi:hypothetical protein
MRKGGIDLTTRRAALAGEARRYGHLRNHGMTSGASQRSSGHWMDMKLLSFSMRPLLRLRAFSGFAAGAVLGVATKSNGPRMRSITAQAVVVVHLVQMVDDAIERDLQADAPEG